MLRVWMWCTFPSAEPFLASFQDFHKDREKPVEETEEPQCHEEMLPALAVCYRAPSSHTAMPVQHPQGEVLQMAAALWCFPPLQHCANAPGKAGDCHAWEERANFFQMAQLSK